MAAYDQNTFKAGFPLRNRRMDPGSQLLTQIQMLAGEDIVILPLKERPWASITFAGTRHYLEILCTGSAAAEKVEKLSRILPDHDFDLGRYFVADLVITQVKKPKDVDEAFRLSVEALTIADPVSGKE